MAEKNVKLSFDIEGSMARSRWQEVSPLVHSLVGKIGELGLTDSLDINLSVSHEQKRKPAWRSVSEFDIPGDIQFRIKPMSDDELEESTRKAGLAIKYRRAELKLTQTKVTERMGDDGSHGWLSNLERNTMTGKRPLAPKVYLLAQALELDPVELLDQYGYEMTVPEEQSE